MQQLSDPITEIAGRVFGINSLFPYQRLVIVGILEASQHPDYCTTEDPPHRRRIVILPTGAGKSLCFQLPALMLPNPTLIVFPLRSLLKDQYRRLLELNIPCALLQGGQEKKERYSLWQKLEAGEIRIVLSNPETVLSPPVFRNITSFSYSHLVIDEAHCIPEWGTSFRPSFLRLRELTERMPVVTAFTATASSRTLSGIRKHLFPDGCTLLHSNPDRQNIQYSVVKSIAPMQTLRSLLSRKTENRNLCPIQYPCLVFASSRSAARLAARMLRRTQNSDSVFFYHAGLSQDEKLKIEKWFFHSRNGILCATCAYGMGIDKPDIRTVIHLEAPSSIEAYIQETGRSGRDRKSAQAILIWKPERSDSALRYYAETKTCRRATLLNLLGSDCSICFGCDRCKKIQMDIEGLKEICQLCARYPRRFTTMAAAQLLCAVPAYQPTQIAGEFSGKLPGWNIQEALGAITFLCQNRILHKRRYWPWKNTLTAVTRCR